MPRLQISSPARPAGQQHFDVAAESARIAALRSDYHSLRGDHDRDPVKPADLDASLLTAMETLEAQLVDEGRWSAGPATLFAALGLVNREVANCRVLGWILDPLAPHGLGTEVLRSLLGLLSARTAESRLQTIGDLARATVVTEEARGSTRADLVVYGAGWSVVIEAKLGAGEQSQQGERLAAEWPDSEYIFLTRSGQPMRTAGDAEWITLSWTELLTLVRDTLAAANAPATAKAVTARAAVRDYLIATRHLEHGDHELT